MKRLYPLLVLLVLALAGCGSATTQASSTAISATQTTQAQDVQATGTADAKLPQACLTSGQKNCFSDTPTTDTPVPGSCAASPSQCATPSGSGGSSGIGAPVDSGTWQVTINSAKTSTGSEFDSPLKAGDIYLTINFTVKNMSASPQETSSYPFTLRDGQGTTYNETYLYGTSVNYGTVTAGQQLRGDLSYEVPVAIHSFILQFDDPVDYEHSQIVQWTIKD